VLLSSPCDVLLNKYSPSVLLAKFLRSIGSRGILNIPPLRRSIKEIFGR